MIDSRSAGDGTIIRRRRECIECEHRFTTYEQLEQRIKELEHRLTERERSEKAFRKQVFESEGKSSGSNETRVSGIRIQWNPEHGTCSFEGLPVALMWVDTTLAGLRDTKALFADGLPREYETAMTLREEG